MTSRVTRALSNPLLKGTRRVPGQRTFQPCVCGPALPSQDFRLPCTWEVGGGRPDPLLSEVLRSGRLDRGCNGAPAPRYLSRGAWAVWGSPSGLDGLLCVWEWQVRLGAWGAALRAAVCEHLAPGSRGSRKLRLSAFSGALPVWEKTARPPTRNVPLPAEPFLVSAGSGLWGKAHVRDPCGVSHTPLSPLGAQEGTWGTTANPTLPAWSVLS